MKKIQRSVKINVPLKKAKEEDLDDLGFLLGASRRKNESDRVYRMRLLTILLRKPEWYKLEGYE